MNGASAALQISDIPFPQPGRRRAHRPGRGGHLHRQPRRGVAARRATLDLVVAGTEDAILMVEAGANEVTEAEILDALDIAHGEIKKLCAAQRELREAGRQGEGRDRAPQVDEAVAGELKEQFGAALERGHPGRSTSSSARTPPSASRRRPSRRSPATPRPTTERQAPQAQLAFDKLEKEIIRQRIAVDKKRPDGRAAEEIRDDLDRGGVAAAHARLRALHPRPDAGLLGRRPRHHARRDAARHARAPDAEALLPPLQLPALLGRGGGLHARSQAPRHRPRRARRAGARAGVPVRGRSRTRSASCPTSSSRTARRRWRRSAARRSR